MNLFCKGMHCAGCGKGIPLGVVVLVIIGLCLGYGSKLSGQAETAIITLGCFLAGAFLIGGLFLVLVLRWGTRNKKLFVAHVRHVDGQLTYGQLKFLETGNVRWLDLTGGTVTIPAEVKNDDSTPSLPMAVPKRELPRRQATKRLYLVPRRD